MNPDLYPKVTVNNIRVFCKEAPSTILTDLLAYLCAAHPVSHSYVRVTLHDKSHVKQSVLGNCAALTKKTTGEVQSILIDVGLGGKRTRRPIEKVLHTLSHEYCHALQIDQCAPFDCPKADAFADQIVPQFLSHYQLPLAA